MTSFKAKSYHKARERLLKTYPSISGRSIVKGTRKLTSEPGVYFIYRVSDFKVYIGESNNIQRRMLEHFTAYRPTQTIDWAISREGADNFRCGVIRTSRRKKERLKLETKYVKLFNSYYNGYNSTNNGKRKNKMSHWLSNKRLKFIKKHMPGKMDNLRYQFHTTIYILGWFRSIFNHRG